MIIKHSPEDFIVGEIPDFKIIDSGNYSIYRLWKRNLTTEHAVEIICRRFDISRNSIKYAGTKDKNAITTQYISIYGNHDGHRIEEENLRMEFIGCCNEPLSLGTLKGNNFEIMVRELSSEEIERLRKNTENINLIPNYFDEQRFSTNNVDIGIAIMKKDYKKAAELIIGSKGIHEDEAKFYLQNNPNDYIGTIKKMPKKILTMYLHSVQSYIFNESLSSCIKSFDENAKEIGYSEGKLAFTDKIMEIRTLPLIGFDTITNDEYIKNIVKRLGITPRDFIIKAIPDLTVEENMREAFIKVENFSVNLEGSVGKFLFDLPKGSYATIVIKALFA